MIKYGVRYSQSLSPTVKKEREENKMIVFIEFIATLVSAVICVVIGCIFKRARKALLIVSFCMVVVFLESAPHITYNDSENDLV